MFSIVDGKKIDAHIHNEILDGISPENARLERYEHYHRLIKKWGVPPRDAAVAAGLNFIENPLSDSPDVLK